MLDHYDDSDDGESPQEEEFDRALKLHAEKNHIIVVAYDQGTSGIYFSKEENLSWTEPQLKFPYPELHFRKASIACNEGKIGIEGLRRGYVLCARHYPTTDGKPSKKGRLYRVEFVAACDNKSDAKSYLEKIRSGDLKAKKTNNVSPELVFTGSPANLFQVSSQQQSCLPSDGGSPADSTPPQQSTLPKPFPECAPSAPSPADFTARKQSPESAPEASNTVKSAAVPHEIPTTVSSGNSPVVAYGDPWVLLWPDKRTPYSSFFSIGEATICIKKDSLEISHVRYGLIKTLGRVASYLENQDLSLLEYVLLMAPNPLGYNFYNDRDLVEVAPCLYSVAEANRRDPSEMPAIASAVQPTNTNHAGTNGGSEHTNCNGTSSRSPGASEGSSAQPQAASASGDQVLASQCSAPSASNGITSGFAPGAKGQLPTKRPAEEAEESSKKAKKSSVQGNIPLQDPYCYLTSSSTSGVRYYKLKTPDEVDPSVCQLFDRTSPWHFQIKSRPGFVPLVPSHPNPKVFIDEGVEVLHEAIKNQPKNEKRIYKNLIRRLLGGPDGVKRAISIYQQEREQATQVKQYVTNFATRTFGEPFIQALEAHSKWMAVLLRRKVMKANNWDSFVSEVIRDDANCLLEKYCHRSRIDFKNLKHIMKRRNVTTKARVVKKDQGASDLIEAKETQLILKDKTSGEQVVEAAASQGNENSPGGLIPFAAFSDNPVSGFATSTPKKAMSGCKTLKENNQGGAGKRSASDPDYLPSPVCSDGSCSSVDVSAWV